MNNMPTRADVLEYFGYAREENPRIFPNSLGNWPKELAIKRIGGIPEFIRLRKSDQRRFRIIIDYDSEYPRTLFQYFEPQSENPPMEKIL